MLNDNVFDEMAYELFHKIKNLKKEDDIKKAISSFLQEADISPHRMNCQFYPTFMANCVCYRPAISSLVSSVFLNKSEWNARPPQPSVSYQLSH